MATINKLNRLLKDKCNRNKVNKTTLPVDEFFREDDEQMWKDIPMFPGYQISNKGYIRSFKSQNKYHYGCILFYRKTSNGIVYNMTDKNNISRTVSLEEINNITKNIKYTCGTFNVPYYNHHRNQHCFIDGDDVNIGKVNKKPRITGTGSLHIFPTVPEGKIPPPLGKKIIQPIKFV